MRPLIFGSCLLAAAAGTISCRDTQPTEEEYDDVAQAIGSTTATQGGGGEVGSISDSAKLAAGELPAGLTLSGSGHITGDRLGVTYDYQISCLDSAGNTLPACGPATDRASLTLSWSGNLDTRNLSTSVDRTGDWTLSGLQSGGATFDGEGTFSFDLAISGPLRSASYHLDYDARYDGVKLDADRRLVGGSVHYSVSAEHTFMGPRASTDRAFELDAVVTFQADGTAALVLDGTHHFRIDLSTGAVAKM